MTINVIYLFVTMIAIYYGTMTYFKTKNNVVLFTLIVLIASILLEIQWLNSGNYIIDTTDLFRTLRDIARTIVTILGFKIHVDNFKKHNNK